MRVTLIVRFRLMAILDFLCQEAPLQSFDFIVVGAGAAGIFMADGLSNAGLNVCLVETGGWTNDDSLQDLNDLEQTAKRQSNCIWNRKRILGGTTTAWGGQALPFSRYDFEARNWLPEIDWPITYNDLLPHYKEANRFLAIDDLNYKTDIEHRIKCFNPGFNSMLLSYHFSKWAPQPNFIKLRKSTLEKRVSVLYHAHVVRLLWITDNKLDGVEVASPTGRKALIRGRSVLLATGGIESVRTLLLAFKGRKHYQRQSLRWLGLGYMDHPTLDLGTIDSENCIRLQSKFATHRYRHWKYSVRLSAAESWLKEHSLPNISGMILFIPTSPRDWLDAIKQLLRKPSITTCFSVLGLVPEIVVGLFYLVFRGFVFRPHAKVRLSVMAEQPPSAESYITLSDQSDCFGLSKAKLHWTIDHKVIDSIKAFAKVLKSELERLGFGEVILDEKLLADDRLIMESLGDVNHHMGGARMSSDPNLGVVDPWMRVWGVENLFVCSSSVFVTSSHSNPTLTLLALCSRLLKRLTS
jgi:choline dehydrogenase-like flavoprotein